MVCVCVCVCGCLGVGGRVVVWVFVWKCVAGYDIQTCDNLRSVNNDKMPKGECVYKTVSPTR